VASEEVVFLFRDSMSIYVSVAFQRNTYKEILLWRRYILPELSADSSITLISELWVAIDRICQDAGIDVKDGRQSVVVFCYPHSCERISRIKGKRNGRGEFEKATNKSTCKFIVSAVDEMLFPLLLSLSFRKILFIRKLNIGWITSRIVRTNQSDRFHAQSSFE